MIVADSVNITKKAAEQISRAALDYANENGYCETVEEFLEHLGFPIPSNEVDVVIRAKVRVPRGDSSSIEYALNATVDGMYDDFEVLSQTVSLA